MGFLDEVRDRAGEFQDRAKDGLAAAKEKASGLIDDARGRMDGDAPAETGYASEPEDLDGGEVTDAPAAATQDEYDQELDPIVAARYDEARDRANQPKADPSPG